ncbi:MAG: hypothetical protein HN618_03105 [Flavobacteriales bacterium]|nr:hypothetical protein [Flavobacteriales bacterium]
MHKDSHWGWWEIEENTYGNSDYFMMKVGRWYIMRTKHWGDDPHVEFYSGTEDAIAAIESAKDDGFDDVLEWGGDPEEVRKLSDHAGSFGSDFTADQIIEIIKGDEHLLCYAYDEDYELPEEYYE